MHHRSASQRPFTSRSRTPHQLKTKSRHCPTTPTAAPIQDICKPNLLNKSMPLVSSSSLKNREPSKINSSNYFIMSISKTANPKKMVCLCLAKNALEPLIIPQLWSKATILNITKTARVEWSLALLIMKLEARRPSYSHRNRIAMKVLWWEAQGTTWGNPRILWLTSTRRQLWKIVDMRVEKY